MTLPFQRKNGSVYSFFSLSIPVTSIQAGAGFLGRRKKSWGRVRGEKERGPLLPSPPLPFACSPCKARLKKQFMLRRLHSKLLEDISVKQMMQRVPDPYGFWTFDWLKCVFKWYWSWPSGGSENNGVKNILSTVAGI